MAKEVKYIVRVANTDLKGQKPVIVALSGITGISDSIANAICHLSGVSKSERLGALVEADVQKLTDAITNLKLPVWMMNRRRDFETGEDKHILGGDLTYTKENDIKRMKSTKSYKGLRHQWGLTLRGQRNQANHRPSKAKKNAATKRGRK